MTAAVAPAPLTGDFNAVAPVTPNTPRVSTAQTRAKAAGRETSFLEGTGQLLEKIGDPNVFAGWMDTVGNYLDLIFTFLFDKENFEVKALAMGHDPYNRYTDGADPKSQDKAGNEDKAPKAPLALTTVMAFAQKAMGGIAPGTPESYSVAATTIKRITTLIPNKDLLLNSRLLNAIAAESDDSLDGNEDNFKATRLTAHTFKAVSDINKQIAAENEGKPADEQRPKINACMMANHIWDTVADLENNTAPNNGINALLRQALDGNTENLTSDGNVKTIAYSTTEVLSEIIKDLGNDADDQYLGLIAMATGEAIDTDGDGKLDAVSLGIVEEAATYLDKDIKELTISEVMDVLKEEKDIPGNEHLKKAYEAMQGNAAMFFDSKVKESLAEHAPESTFKQPEATAAPAPGQ